MRKFITIILSVFCVLTIKAQEINIIPQPTSIDIDKGEFTLSAKTFISYTNGLEDKAEYLQEVIETSTGLYLNIIEGSKKKGGILLTIDSNRVTKNEGYELVVSNQNINIYGADPGGVFYGIQTLLQLFPAEIYSSNIEKGVKWSAPAVIIKDAPNFPWRGMMFDSARYFYTKEFIKKYIDMMAMYKLNKLHFHFIDDSGWRLEIKKYPRLTEIGAWAGEGANRLGGYYTQEDIKELIAYAALRNVEIIPEIAFPAHMLSAVVAYPWLSCKAEEHEVPTQHFISRDLLCVGNKDALKFLEDVLEETISLFPSKYFGIGGDEAVYTHWETCPKCQALKQELGLSKTSELQGHLTNVVSDMLKKHNRTAVGWEEIAQRGKLNNKVVSLIWRNLSNTKDILEQGHNVVLTPASHAYVDFPESKIPGEPKAAAWMPPISLEKCYSLNAEDYDHKSLILGIQGCYWSDQFIHGTVLQEINLLNENRSERYAEYFSFPRVLALAEIGWSSKDRRDYKNFENRIKSHFGKLDQKDCSYRVPLPLIKTLIEDKSGATFTLENSVANSTIRYTTDGTYPHKHSKEYTTPVTVPDKSNFRAITLTPNNYTSLALHIEEKYAEFKEYGELTAEWKPSFIDGGDEFCKWRFEATGKISDNGTYEITFVYTDGSNGLNINSVKLYKRDEFIGEDNHKEAARHNSKNNTYTITVDNFEAGTPFYIDAMIQGRLGNDSYGAVFIKKVQ